MNQRQNYTIPKLCNRKGDLKKDWFVYFYYTDNQTGVKKLFRYKSGINRFKTKKEREREGELIRSAHLDMLKDGWNPFNDTIEPGTGDVLIMAAIDMALELKKMSIKGSSSVTYTDHCKSLKNFISSKRLDSLFLNNFSQTHMQMYLDYLLIKKGNNASTHNNHLSTMHSLFTVLVKRKLIKTNPCTGIEKLKEEKGKNTTYTPSEELKFKEYCNSIPRMRGFYLATRFVRYCFMRRPELRGMKVGHISMDSGTITIPSDSAKSGIQDSMTIPKTMEGIIRESGILELDPEMYVFGKLFKPSFEKSNDYASFSEKQKDVNRLLKIKEESTFYSWKHTGVVELYNLTKDPYAVMRQCRHKDLLTTMRYLRSLGCGTNESVRNW